MLMAGFLLGEVACRKAVTCSESCARCLPEVGCGQFPSCCPCFGLQEADLTRSLCVGMFCNRFLCRGVKRA